VARGVEANPRFVKHLQQDRALKNLAPGAQSMADAELENLWKQSARYVTTTSVGPGYTAG